ncbi:MAG: GNAT family N-acetyltransferase [Prevotella sp.]|nr:GNAT family N-acetyltransferase [Prevotella sp.]
MNPDNPETHTFVTPEADVMLRALEPEDLDFLYTLENDSAMWLVGNANVPYSRFTLNNYVMTSSSDIYADRQLRLIIQKPDGTSVGLLDIFDFDPRHLRAEVGVAILKEERDKGYGHVALMKAIDYCRRIIHLHQLYALIDVRNTHSLQLFQGAGFNKASLLKDWLYDGGHFCDACMMHVFL